MDPVIEEMNKSYDGKVNFIKIDVDDSNLAEIVQMYEIMSIPTYIFLKDGKPMQKRTGAMPKRNLQAELEKLVEQK
jgi:thioredoxin 1